LRDIDERNGPSRGDTEQPRERPQYQLLSFAIFRSYTLQQVRMNGCRPQKVAAAIVRYKLHHVTSAQS
jgi:hypothetical protein